MRAALPAVQHRPRRAFRLAGRAEIAAIETIESAIGGEEGEPALVACDDTGGAVVNFDDVGFGHGCSFADNAGAPVECVISGFATGGSATGAGRRRDAATGDALAHIAHGWLWIQFHAVTPNSTSNIRRFAELVNEMGVQSFNRDISAFLHKHCKTDGSILREL